MCIGRRFHTTPVSTFSLFAFVQSCWAHYYCSKRDLSYHDKLTTRLDSNRLRVDMRMSGTRRPPAVCAMHMDHNQNLGLECAITIMTHRLQA
jgi:hypothetical protein